MDKLNDYAGPEARCICPNCGEQLSNRRPVPCPEERCPECGSRLLREGLHHHSVYQTRHAAPSSD